MASSAQLFSFVTSVNTFVDSILAVSASFDDGFGSGIAKGAKSTLAFTVKNLPIFTKMSLTNFATFREAIDSTFAFHNEVVFAITSGGHGNAGKKSNNLKMSSGELCFSLRFDSTYEFHIECRLVDWFSTSDALKVK